MPRLLVYVVFIIAAVFIGSCTNSFTQETDPTPFVGGIQETSNIVSSTFTVTEDIPSVTPTMTSTPTITPTPRITMPLMGVEAHYPEQENVIGQLLDSGSQIVRYGSVIWYMVEPQESQYNWTVLQPIDSALQKLAANNFEVILIVRGTPDWAQKVNGSACGPITQEKFVAFANFMTELVRRYSVPPYNVKYWEIGNEPDVAPELVPSESGFGCWGDSQDVFYGGGYYAEMLKVVYPAIKAADPEAQVLNGGLLLDCDPYHPPEGKDCLPARFLNGILANGGADFFDIVNFHGYAPYVDQSLSGEWKLPGWANRGGVILGKIYYLKEVMQQYGVDKPIFQTEGSLTCPEWNTAECLPPDELFFETQADFVVRLFVRNWALDIAGTIWYDFEGQGWRYSGLVGNDSNNPKPVYRAFKYMNEKLEGMIYIGKPTLPEGMEGYMFSDAGRQTWVVWSQDESPQRMVLPSNVISVYDKFGQEITLQDAQMTITSPLYFDIEQ